MRKKAISLILALLIGCSGHVIAQDEILISINNHDHATALALIKKTSKKKLDKARYFGLPLLACVTLLGDYSCTEAMIVKGVDINAGGFFLNSDVYINPLAAAVVKRDLRKMHLLLDQGADPNITVTGQQLTVLNYAIDGFPTAVPDLVAAGADVNGKTPSGLTPLQGAITNHLPELALWLMDRGADVNQEIPLMTAVTFKEFDIAVELIRRGAKVDVMIGQQQQRSPLWLFLLNTGNPDILKALESENIPVNSKVLGDFTPLMLLSGEQGKLNTVKWLIAQGADVNMRTSFGMHVLQFAVNSGSYDIAKALIDAGAETEDTPAGFRDPITDVISRQADTLLPLLLHQSKGSFRVDWLLQALRTGRESPIRTLMDQPETRNYINVPNKAGYTALFAAVASGSLRTVRDLMPYAPDTTFVGPDGMTGRMAAGKLGYRSIENYLKDPLSPVNDSLHPENWYSTVRFMFDYSNNPDTLALAKISDIVLNAIDQAYTPGSYAHLQQHFHFSNRLLNSILANKAILSFQQTLTLLHNHKSDFPIGPVDSIYMAVSIQLALGNLFSRRSDTKSALASYLAAWNILEDHSDLIASLTDVQAKTMFYQSRYFSIVNILTVDTEKKYSDALFPELEKIIQGPLLSAEGNIIGTPEQMMFNSELVSLLFNSPEQRSRTFDVLMRLGASLSILMNDFTFLERSQQTGFLNRLYYDTYVLCNILKQGRSSATVDSSDLESLLQSVEDRSQNLLSAFSFILASKSARLESETIKRRFVRDRGTDFINAIFDQRERMYNRGGVYLRQGTTAPDEIYRKYYEYDVMLNSQLRALMYLEKDMYNASSIRSKIAENEAVVEFVAFPLLGDGNEGKIFYAALVLRHSSEGLKFIPLCEHKVIDSLTGLLYGAVEANRGTIIKGLQQPVTFDSVMAECYRMIWAPLVPELEGIQKLVISPDYQLSRIPFAALVTADHTRLVDHYQIRILQTSRSLLESPRPAFSEATRMTFYGNMNFTFQQDDSAAYFSKQYHEIYSQDYSLDRQSTRSDAGGLVWKNLPGTLLEYEALKQVCGPELQLTAIMGDRALEEAFKMQHKISPEIIHIATHGYYFQADADTTGRVYYQNSTEPLMRSGLVFSGANEQPVEGREDGILTAFEISAMDLSNTSLVVLSACETGLGDLSGSEGTLGLQRAFKMSGVRYIIQTLWEIPDQGPEEFFKTFYTLLLHEYKDIGTAFNETVRMMRDKYPNRPELWAAFVLIE